MTEETLMSKELVPVLVILIPPPCGTKVVFGVELEVPELMVTVFAPTLKTLFV